MNTRQQIVDAIAARVRTITTANGYATDCGKSVEVQRITPLAEKEMPIVCIDDGKASYGEEGNYMQVALQVTAEVFMARSGADAYVRAAMNDIIRAIGLDYRLGGLVEKVIHDSTDIALQQTDFRYVAGQVSFRADYREPYPSEADMDGQAPFLRFRDSWDLAQKDGQVDAQDAVDLEGLT
jgi:hypothetical protein